MPSSGFVEIGSNVRNRPKEIIGLYVKSIKKEIARRQSLFTSYQKKRHFIIPSYLELSS